MIPHCYNIKEFLKKSFIFVLAFILLFEIESIKSVIKNILVFAEKNNILLGVKLLEISKICVFIRKYAVIYLVLCIICLPLVNLYLLIRNHYNSPINFKLNPFEDSLYKSIYEYSKVESVIEEEGIGLSKEYNQFVQKNKNPEEQSI